jgi:hypothetical protein
LSDNEYIGAILLMVFSHEIGLERYFLFDCFLQFIGENADAVISNICICIIRLPLFGIRICIMQLLSVFKLLLWLLSAICILGNTRFELLYKSILKIK